MKGREREQGYHSLTKNISLAGDLGLADADYSLLQVKANESSFDQNTINE